MPKLSELTDHKLTKASVKYTDEGHKNNHCSICEHYINNNTCQIVIGKIKPMGWCNRFEKY
jgi:dihydroorotase